MHEKHPGISSTWILPIDDRHYVKVFVWDTIDAMWAAFPHKKPDFAGLCQASAWFEHTKTGTRRAGNKFAEIHLDKNSIGAGVVAHEIAHLINYWSEFAGYTYLDDDEKIADLTGRLTSAFWVEFYKLYKEC